MKRSIAAAAIALAVAMPSAAAQPNGEPKLGYWWYAPKPAEPGEADEDQLPPAPVIPPMTELARDRQAHYRAARLRCHGADGRCRR